jgi:D-beta-D-heptose 7-phosphate kinase/D-beta-D-heptose 1-phosphate adenosyltransferase
MKIVLVTGGFDPLHSGHIAYFKAARTLGDMLIVGLNSDEWLTRKKGRPFMSWTERLCVINNLTMVDETYTFDDADGSAKEFIRQVRAHYPDATLVFANGGDRTDKNIPEMDVADTNITFVFGVGGHNKANSSSWILEEWKAPRTERPWGYYRILHEVPGTKVKELTVNPGQTLSMQRHNSRAEYWQAIHGKGAILECELETELLIDMLTNDQRSNAFLDLAKEIIPTIGGTNDRLNEYFGRDGEVVNRLRPVLQSQGYCGIRMAFCLGNPVAADGNLFPNQHIQICLWN